MTKICFDEKSLGEYNDRLKKKFQKELLEKIDSNGYMFCDTCGKLCEKHSTGNCFYCFNN